jgi:hypothetical protein
MAATPPAAPAAPTPCTIAVKSAPLGATVSLGSKHLGQTPLEVEVPCDAVAVLTFSKQRYAETTARIKVRTGKPGKMKVKLERPLVSVTVRASPAGASITMDGGGAPKSPATFKVSAFTRHEVGATMKGFKPYAGEVAPSKDQSTAIKLEPLPHPRPGSLVPH